MTSSLHNVIFVSKSISVPYQSTSSILRPDPYHDATQPHIISSHPLETYGDASAPNVIGIGNGGLGATGILAELCNDYLCENQIKKDLRIEWVCNHSRHTQAALQAGVVDVALTYEREEENAAAKEGWSRTIDILCHDHFVLAGPSEDLARVASHIDVAKSLQRIALEGLNGDGGVVFHTRGDGSATMHKEHALWDLANVSQFDRDNTTWYRRFPCTPLDALRHANQERAYLLTDRATFLVAKSRGEINNMVIFNEGGRVLLNTCAILVRSVEERKSVMDLVEWLLGDRAQQIIEHYGKDTKLGTPLVTRRNKAEVDEIDELKKLSTFPITFGELSKPALTGAIGNPENVYTTPTYALGGLKVCT